MPFPTGVKCSFRWCRVVKQRWVTSEFCKDQLVTEGPRLCGDEWNFQQDNAAIHNARHTLTFLQENGIRVLGHPTCSPDFNAIENV